MKHLFSLNAEGGFLLCMDAQAATRWKGSEPGSYDYQRVCDSFDGRPGLEAIGLMVAEHPAIVWEMSGPGTADVFELGENKLRIVRAWLDEDSPEVLKRLASAEAAHSLAVGEIEVRSGMLAFLWGPESGTQIPRSLEHDVQPVAGTAIDGSAFVLRAPNRRYRCQHDEVNLETAHARRLTLVPA